MSHIIYIFTNICLLYDTLNENITSHTAQESENSEESRRAHLTGQIATTVKCSANCRSNGYQQEDSLQHRARYPNGCHW
jgi:hypothetical protein